MRVLAPVVETLGVVIQRGGHFSRITHFWRAERKRRRRTHM